MPLEDKVKSSCMCPTSLPSPQWACVLGMLVDAAVQTSVRAAKRAWGSGPAMQRDARAEASGAQPGPAAAASDSSLGGASAGPAASALASSRTVKASDAHEAFEEVEVEVTGEEGEEGEVTMRAAHGGAGMDAAKGAQTGTAGPAVPLGGYRAKATDPRMKFARGSPLHPDGEGSLFG